MSDLHTLSRRRTEVRRRDGDPAPQRRRRDGSRPNSWRTRAEIAFFVTPALVLFAMFVVVPVIQAARYSVYSWNGLGPPTDFVGLDNYRRALTTPTFTGAFSGNIADPSLSDFFSGAIMHNLVIVVLSIVIQLPLGLAIALLLNRKIWGRTLLRVVIFMPYVLAEVVAGVIWAMLLQPRGPFTAMFEAVGLGDYAQLWLADPDIALFTVMGVITWKYLGLAIILFLAGLQGVPEDLYEAAQLDGANWWQVQWRITVPLLGPTIRTWGFLSIIGSLQLFDMVYILTGGGPLDSTITMAIYMIDNGANRSLYGYASAVAVILFVISFTIAVLYQTLVLKRDNADDTVVRTRKQRRAEEAAR
ncbi:carbohydrate ABC transporter permease [Bogoriella caseilytica]|uniref:Carbohydrate ABC transporter membrane protein 1 (CUT1 family) n=1 Tax=Bogoriella caseilytica TaxID=56055 RepID=A0A3N2BFP3_9MICO|nr:sugar ABC transporter permease [Bogoriella caseilytica]ROR74038.1 carbohydrate ABC transporter membrane protein 1 (CUT1 family) [Bogoriella caseilytica]